MGPWAAAGRSGVTGESTLLEQLDLHNMRAVYLD